VRKTKEKLKMKAKVSRKEKNLLEKLAPDSKLNEEVYNAIVRVAKEYDGTFPSDGSLANFDKVMEKYVRTRIELDRVQRKNA
jgi:hypothetical protein